MSGEAFQRCTKVENATKASPNTAALIPPQQDEAFTKGRNSGLLRVSLRVKKSYKYHTKSTTSRSERDEKSSRLRGTHLQKSLLLPKSFVLVSPDDAPRPEELLGPPVPDVCDSVQVRLHTYITNKTAGSG